MKRLISFLCAVVMWPVVSASAVPDGLGDVLVQPGKFRPLPDATSAFWRDSLPEAMRRSYISYGEQYAGRPWASLPVTLFAEFKANGNRTRYEAACFGKRRRLAALAMAEVVEGEGRFVGDIADGLMSLCEETWWGIPAHYGKNIPVPDDQNVDLFNAETAGLVAWIRYMLGPWLDAFAPDLCRRIDSEVRRRMLVPVLKRNYWWKRAGMNWNPWICSNWLACLLLCENDRDRQMEGVAQVMQAMQAFVDAYPADGGCDEGTGYWDRAAASLFECMRLLDMATGGREGTMTPKVKEMMRYIYKMYIGNGYCVNFADAHDNRMQAQPDIVLPMALSMGDAEMAGMAAYIAREHRLFDSPAALYDRSGNFPAFGRELFMLRGVAAAQTLTPREPQTADVWLPDLQVMTARRGALYVAVKGGHNGENHNHNDVGSFIVYADGRPLLIDVGVGEYTSATFGGDRYTIWTMQSAYHNLPLINGRMQKEGKEHAARVVAHSKGSLTLDLAGAYPAEAAVHSWLRRVTAKAGGIEIKEEYSLGERAGETQIMLITTTRPVVAGGGRLMLGDRYCVKYDARRLTADVEDISGMMDSLLCGVWGDSLFRIVLTLRSEAVAGSVTYRVVPAR